MFDPDVTCRQRELAAVAEQATEEKYGSTAHVFPRIDGRRPGAHVTVGSMLCPVCGERFGAGVKRCPTHGVELADDPPDDRRLADRLAAPVVARGACVSLVLTALLYALASTVLSVLLVVRDSGYSRLLETAQVVQVGALPLAIASLLVLAAIVLLRAHAALTARSGLAASGDGRRARAMRYLLVPLVLCAAVWALTGVVGSKQLVEHDAGARRLGVSVSPPSDSLLTLLAVNNAAYAGAVGALVVMGGVLMVAGYERVRGGAAAD